MNIMTEANETLIPEQRAERFFANCGCRACSETGHLLNVKPLNLKPKPSRALS